MNHPFPNTRNERLAAPESATKAHSKLRKQNRLGEKLWLFGKGRGKKEAKPVKPLERTSAAPTPERQVRAPNGWKEEAHPGGQVSYQELSTLEPYRVHLSEDDKKFWEMLVDDAETAEIVKINARAYNGMPHPGSSHAGGAIDATGELRDVLNVNKAMIAQGKRANRHDFMMRHMNRHVDFWTIIVRTVILGVRYQRIGRPLSAAEISAMLMASKDKREIEGGGIALVKATLVRAREAYHAWFEAQPIKIIEPQSDGMKAMQAEREFLKRLEKPRGRS